MSDAQCADESLATSSYSGNGLKKDIATAKAEAITRTELPHIYTNIHAPLNSTLNLAT